MMDKGLQSFSCGVDLKLPLHIGDGFGTRCSEAPMNTGKTLFARLWTFSHGHLSSYRSEIQRRPSGALSSLCRSVSDNVFRPTYLSGESPRYRSLFVGTSCKTLSHGLRGPVQSFDSGRRQRISRLAHLRRLRSRLIAQARKLYAGESFGVDISNTAYALDATTIDLCLSMFHWAPFRTAKAAVKSSYPNGPQGSIPSFIHISDGKLHMSMFSICLFPKPVPST